jgi:hypothetical protein
MDKADDLRRGAAFAPPSRPEVGVCRLSGQPEQLSDTEVNGFAPQLARGMLAPSFIHPGA